MAADGLPDSSAHHRLRLATSDERDQVANYLRLGGWEVESRGRRDLRAKWRHDRSGESGRVNLRFSVAVWRAMHR